MLFCCHLVSFVNIFVYFFLVEYLYFMRQPDLPTKRSIGDESAG